MANKFKFIDLFAGIGGFHQAMHSIGGECVFASEKDKSARETYEKNFKLISENMFSSGLFNDDIRKISPYEIPDFDVLCAGFPCQPFSQAGFKKGFDDVDNSERGNLFFNIADIIEAKKPKAFFLENVRGIVNHDDGRTIKIIREILQDELGYSFHLKVVKATDYGLPQHRPRAFMIGFRGESVFSNFTFPEKIPLKFNMSDVFGGECSREIGFTLRVGGAGSNINDRRNWDSYLVNGEVTRIQPVHGLKMLGFPDGFKMPKSRTAAMKQLGNSVAVDAVKECAKNLIKYMEKVNTGTAMKLTKNKGEWSELYSFFKIIHDRKIGFGDSKMMSTGEYLSVDRLSTDAIDESILLVDDNSLVVTGSDGSNLLKIQASELITQEIIDELKNKIIEGKGTFEIEQFTLLCDGLGIGLFHGANSSQKSDIELDVDIDKQKYTKQGFGIKSYLGSKPTLLNASGSNTNFVFEVKGIDDDLVVEVSKIKGVKSKILFILENGGIFHFEKMETDAMEYNLALIDSEFALFMSKMVLAYYSGKASRLVDCLDELYKNNELEINKKNDEISYQIKLKRFLMAIMLGMFSGKKWDGEYDANGQIVIKEDGEHLGYHITRKEDMENYLFENLKFDTPSTTRHRFGQLRKENGCFLIKLNMQIRF